MLERLLILIALTLATQMAGAVTIYKTTDANGVVSFSDRPSPGSSVLVFRDRMVERIEQQVHLSIRREKGVHSLYVRNDLYAPVEVELKLSNVKNVLGVAGASSTLRRTIPARSNERVVVLSPKVADKAMNYASMLTSTLGDPKGSVQAYRYPLPWIGGPFRLTQGPGGKYSHYGVKGRYAMDIAMPEGTPIIAARGGTVVKIENSQSGRGSNASGNFVRILHNDGTMGVYLHLMRGSVSVNEGQHVVVGTALARSGNTGNSTGPHLHFVVQRNSGNELVSIPYEFAQPVQSLPDFAVGGN
ncbi:M23 family metallopeptidase [Pseudomonas sp. CDFA 602]|uniref:peptidoglycan DD-metalloendopeptidase family protein n=1 Tax=Pseudomonas californiensis TaxID=2829823 RepID=UPI001E3989DA|nr:peptidoglycan DD-metalloendopeptidase family protein [Pseudomonas californiensis]MCD5995372.1 M23 family metallopeptidase [Pseudomonas californiensis]MCD6001032.1 M23 family metallopeptidase [Pseudomonas californiensis]